MALAKELRKQLARYTSDDLDMKAFRDWFLPVLRDVHKSGDAEAEKLAHEVEWEFVDLERGLLPSENALKANLSQLCSGNATVLVANAPEPQNSNVEVVRQEAVAHTTSEAGVLVMVAGNSGGHSTTVYVVEQQPVSRNESSLSHCRRAVSCCCCGGARITSKLVIIGSRSPSISTTKL